MKSTDCPVCCAANKNVPELHKKEYIQEAGRNTSVTYLHLPQDEDTVVSDENEEIRLTYDHDNSKKKSLPILPVIPNNEISVNCERCKKILECSKKLLRSVPNLFEKDLINVCNHCGFVDKYRDGCSCCKKIADLCVTVDENHTKSFDFKDSLICDDRNSSLKLKNRSYSDSNIHKSIKVNKYFFAIKKEEDKVAKDKGISKINNKKEVLDISLSSILLNQFSNTMIGKKSNLNKYKSYSELDLNKNYYEYLNAQAENMKIMKIAATDMTRNSYILQDTLQIGIHEKGKTQYLEAVHDQNLDATKYKIINQNNIQRNMPEKNHSSFLSIKSLPKDYDITGTTKVLEALQVKNHGATKYNNVNETKLQRHMPEKHRSSFMSIKYMPKDYDATGKTQFLEAVQDQNLGAKKYGNIKKNNIVGTIPEDHSSFLSIKSLPKDYDADDLEYFFPKAKKKEPQSTMVPSSEIISDLYNKLQEKLKKEQELKEEYLKSLKNKETKSSKTTEKKLQKDTNNDIIISKTDETKDSYLEEKKNENLNGDKTESKQDFNESYAKNSKLNKLSETMIRTKSPKTGQRQTTPESSKEQKRDDHLVQTGIENKKEVESKATYKQNKAISKRNEMEIESKSKHKEQQPKIKLDPKLTEDKSTNKNKIEVDSKVKPPEQHSKIKIDSKGSEAKSTNKNKKEVDSKVKPPEQQSKINIDSKDTEAKSTNKTKSEVDSKSKSPEQHFKVKPGLKVTEVETTTKNEKEIDSKSKDTKDIGKTTKKNEKELDSKLKPKEQQPEIPLNLNKSTKTTKDSQKAPTVIEVKIKEYNILKQSQKGDQSEGDKKGEKKETLTPSFDLLDLEIIESDLSESDKNLKKVEEKLTDAIVGEKIIKFNPLYGEKNLVKESRISGKEPLVFMSDYKDDYSDFKCKDKILDSLNAGIKTKTLVRMLVFQK